MSCRSSSRRVGLLICLLEAACSSSGSPANPSLSPTVRSVTIAANLTSVTSAGQTTQATATASLSNGTSQDVTTMCTNWQSDNSAVLTVNATGLLTALGSGSATITATCQGSAARGLMTVTLKPATSPAPSTFALSGTVTDGFSGGLLPNIVVRITDGPNVGITTRTDGTGNYLIAGLSPGTFTVSFSAVSYLSTKEAVTLGADTRLDVVLHRNYLYPYDGTYPYSLTLHLVSASGCSRYSAGATDPQPAPFADVTFENQLAVSGDGIQLRFGPLPWYSNGNGLVVDLRRSGNQVSGTVGGSTGGWAPGMGVFVYLDLTVMSGTVDNSNGRITGISAGPYFDNGFPYYWQCNTSQIAFTLAPGR